MRLDLDIKEKCFHGITAIGAITGLLEGTMSNGFALHHAFPGIILTLTSAFVGGFIGFLLKDAFRVMRGQKPYRGVECEGMMLGAFTGALVGTLVQVAGSTTGANLILGSMGGAFIGAMIGALPDEFVTPILALMHREPEHVESEHHIL